MTFAPSNDTTDKHLHCGDIEVSGRHMSQTQDQQQLHSEELEGSADIAVVGMAGAFPGAHNIHDYWQRLHDQQENITFFNKDELLQAGLPPELIDNPAFVPARGIFEDAPYFDESFFGMSPKQAQLTDPQHRKFLECCWHALEHAGYTPEAFNGSIGVYAGCSANTYLINNLLPQQDVLESLGGLQAILANDKDHLATFTSYKLGLTGPSLTIQTACSTSLVALQIACMSLLNYQCDMALTGGVSVAAPMKGGHLHRNGDILSADGHCRAFDASSTGTVSGDGVGVVVLKRLEDAIDEGDTIHAIIKAAAINNDGDQKVAYTAPSVDGQAEVISTALTLADISPTSISYIEAHGTGTALGDPIEITALTQAYREETDNTGFCAIGSVKTNIGHLNAASGIAGVIKTILALQHKTIPASLHFSSPNPQIQFDKTPFYVNTHTKPWEDVPLPRRAGVSSFGAGGTNAHVILEEAPSFFPLPQEETPQLFLLSSHKAEHLQTIHTDLIDTLQTHDDWSLPDIAYTLQEGRREQPYRASFVATHHRELVDQLQQHKHVQSPPAAMNRPEVVFLCAGQGFQKSGMGASWFHHDAHFQTHLTTCRDIILAKQGFDLFEHLYRTPPDEDTALDEQHISAPAIFSLSYALAKTLEEYGIQPDILLGHSAGEYTAACLAGVFDVETALSLLATRAKLLKTLPQATGLYVHCDLDEALSLQREGVHLSLVNGPKACVFTGAPETIAHFEAEVSKQHNTKQLRITAAFHSALMDPIIDAFRAEAQQYTYHPPQRSMLSGVTGTYLTHLDANAEYWVKHLQQMVRYDQAFSTLAPKEKALYVELGPRHSVGGIARHNLPSPEVFSPLKYDGTDKEHDEGISLQVLGEGWCLGLPLSTNALHDKPRRRLPLPPRPFSRNKHWLDAPNAQSPKMGYVTSENTPKGTQTDSTGKTPRPTLAIPYDAPRGHVEEVLASISGELLGFDGIGRQDPFLELGGDSLFVLRLIERAEKALKCQLPQEAAFQGVDVAALAEYISAHLTNKRTERTSTHTHILIPMRRTGSRPPLYFVHPAAGVVFPYFELARQLGPEQPFYGVQALGLDGQTSPDHTVEEMARHYIEAIRAHQPKGPYHIGAFSFGALVAYEMALQLEDLGEEVGVLALLDESAPIKGFRPGLLSVAQLFLGNAGKSFLKHYHDHLYLSQRTKKKGLFGVRQAWQMFLERSAMATIIPEESLLETFEQPALHAMAELFFIHLRANFTYTPRRAYKGDVLLCKSEWWKDRSWWSKAARVPDMGWSQLIKGEIVIEHFACDHLALLRKPYVRDVAAYITEAMTNKRQR